MLVVIDGNWYAYRLHHRLRGLQGTGNAPIGACFGYADLFKRLRDNPTITHWAIVFDHPDKSFRHDIDPDYKAHRPSMPEELRSQWPHFIPLAEATGIPVLCLPGIEGDDTLAGFHAWGHMHDVPVRLATIDKDLEQIVDPMCQLWDPFSDSIRDTADIIRRRGVQPRQIGDWLCLCGDAADNIHGAPGIGPKRASSLLNKYGTIENIFAHAQEQTPAIQRGLADLEERIDHVKHLVTLNPPGPLDLPGPDALRKSQEPTDIAAAVAAYQQLGLIPERFFPDYFKQKPKPTFSTPQCLDLWESTIEAPEHWHFDRTRCGDDLAWWRDQNAAAEAAATAEGLPSDDNWQWLDDKTPHPHGSWQLPDLRRLARFQNGPPRLMAQRALARQAVRCLEAWLEQAQAPRVVHHAARLRNLPADLQPPVDLPERYMPWRHLSAPTDQKLCLVNWPRLEWGLLAAASNCPTCIRLAQQEPFSAPLEDSKDLSPPGPGQELAAKAAFWRNLLNNDHTQRTLGQRWLEKVLDEGRSTGSVTTAFGRLIPLNSQMLTSPWSYRLLALTWLQGSAIDAMDWWTAQKIASAQAQVPTHSLSCSGIQWKHQALLAGPESFVENFLKKEETTHIHHTFLNNVLQYCQPTVTVV